MWVSQEEVEIIAFLVSFAVAIMFGPISATSPALAECSFPS